MKTEHRESLKLNTSMLPKFTFEEGFEENRWGDMLPSNASGACASSKSKTFDGDSDKWASSTLTSHSPNSEGLEQLL